MIMVYIKDKCIYKGYAIFYEIFQFSIGQINNKEHFICQRKYCTYLLLANFSLVYKKLKEQNVTI